MIKLLLASALLLTMGCNRSETKVDKPEVKDTLDEYPLYVDTIINTGNFKRYYGGRLDSIIISKPGEGHFDGVIINDTAEWRPVLAGHKYPPGYARFTRGGLPILKWKEIRFGVDENMMHRLLVVRRDSVIVNKGR